MTYYKTPLKPEDRPEPLRHPQVDKLLEEALSVRERGILKFIWLQEDGIRRTREEAAQEFGLLAYRIELIERKALARLRRPR